MKQIMKMSVCLLLLLALCSCKHEAKLAGVWEGDGSLSAGIPALNGAERWEFDGDSAAVATVNGKNVQLHYYATDDTLTLNDGGEMSWGVQYEVKGNTLRIGGAEFRKVK